ncbi:ribosomal protein S18-alanine N-acetyltransferase [Chloroflexota bacterium]
MSTQYHHITSAVMLAIVAYAPAIITQTGADMMPRSQEYTVCPMKLEDVPQVALIERECFPNPWPPTEFTRGLSGHSPTHYLVACAENRVIVGYGGVLSVLDEAHVTTIGVQQSMRRRGIGELLLDALLEHARQHNAQSVMLEVRASNQAAQALYQKHGFATVGLRRTYYEGGEDAMLMTKHDHRHTEPSVPGERPRVMEAVEQGEKQPSLIPH